MRKANTALGKGTLALGTSWYFKVNIYTYKKSITFVLDFIDSFVPCEKKKETRGKFSKRLAAQSNFWPRCANCLLNYQPINWLFMTVVVICLVQ